MTPPPLPKPAAHRIFYGRLANEGARLVKVGDVTERVHSAHQQAEEWLNANRNIEVISISNGSAENAGAHATFVTIWYR